jgi:hypothetical protein
MAKKMKSGQKARRSYEYDHHYGLSLARRPKHKSLVNPKRQMAKKMKSGRRGRRSGHIKVG